MKLLFFMYFFSQQQHWSVQVTRWPRENSAVAVAVVVEAYRSFCL